MQFEWRRAPEFAEIAEALKLSTDQIVMARVGDPRGILVMYTPDEEGRPPFWRARLVRDDNDLLVIDGTPEELAHE